MLQRDHFSSLIVPDHHERDGATFGGVPQILTPLGGMVVSSMDGLHSLSPSPKSFEGFFLLSFSVTLLLYIHPCTSPTSVITPRNRLRPRLSPMATNEIEK